ncbi:hypothetical protein FQN54_009796 [Arachnomyces sp. PD_36]|nr:hypothetical protein FQN54_009796 [Arachnomyces sp. PD_36]
MPHDIMSGGHLPGGGGDGDQPTEPYQSHEETQQASTIAESTATRQPSLDLNYRMNFDEHVMTEDAPETPTVAPTEEPGEPGPDLDEDSAIDYPEFGREESIHSFSAPIPRGFARRRRANAMSRRHIPPVLRSLRSRPLRYALRQERAQQQLANEPEDSSVLDFNQRAARGLIPGFGAARKKSLTEAEQNGGGNWEIREMHPWRRFYNLAEQFAALEAGVDRAPASAPGTEEEGSGEKDLDDDEKSEEMDTE